VLVPLLGGIVLLAAMVAIEARSKAPLIPLRFFTNRTRVVANVAGLFFVAAFMSYIFLLTLFEQQILGYSPLKSGLSYLPFGVSIGVGIGLGTALTPRLGVKPLLGGSLFGAAAGLLLASGINESSSYLTGVLPGMVVFGLSAGIVTPTGANAALHQVTGQDSSLASGVQQSVQQIGAALGLACLVTLALRYATSEVGSGVGQTVAATHGYALAFRVAAGMLVVVGALVLGLLERVAAQPQSPVPEKAGSRG
jgi:predicted MFS family arabinose efflux permease